MLTTVLTDKKQIRQDTRELIDKVASLSEPSERRDGETDSPPEIPEEINILPEKPLLKQNVIYEFARRRGLYGI